jgi:ABC-type phosphate transport system auxiliary subunit
VSRKILQKLKGFSRTQWLILIAFVLVLAFTGFQIFRTVQRANYWRQHHEEPIAGWMRIGYVANSYHVPPQVLQEAIGLPPNVPDRRPLAEIAKSQNRSFAELKADLEKAINDFRQTHQPPGAGGVP